MILLKHIFKHELFIFKISNSYNEIFAGTFNFKKDYNLYLTKRYSRITQIIRVGSIVFAGELQDIYDFCSGMI